MLRVQEFVFTFAYGPEGGETTMQLDANAGGSARATINNLGGGAGAKAGGVSCYGVLRHNSMGACFHLQAQYPLCACWLDIASTFSCV